MEGQPAPYPNPLTQTGLCTAKRTQQPPQQQSVLQAKCLSELLGKTMRGDNQLKNPFTWGVLVLWFLLMLFWLSRMNLALKMFDGVFIIPVLQVAWTCWAILHGGTYGRTARACGAQHPTPRRCRCPHTAKKALRNSQTTTH